MVVGLSVVVKCSHFNKTKSLRTNSVTLGFLLRMMAIDFISTALLSFRGGATNTGTVGSCKSEVS